MSNKIKVFLDFDSTIVNSVKRFVEIANKKFNMNKSPDELGSYDFRNLYHNITQKEVYEIFSSEEFFNNELEYMPNVINVLDKYNDKFDFYISTASHGKNLELKKIWISENMPYVKGIFSSDGNDKSNIDMRHAIQIDDMYECLEHTNSYVKILYKNGNNFAWQRHDNDDMVYDVNDWNEIGSMFDYYLMEGLN